MWNERKHFQSSRIEPSNVKQWNSVGLSQALLPCCADKKEIKGKQILWKLWGAMLKRTSLPSQYRPFRHHFCHFAWSSGIFRLFSNFSSNLWKIHSTLKQSSEVEGCSGSMLCRCCAAVWNCRSSNYNLAGNLSCALSLFCAHLNIACFRFI